MVESEGHKCRQNMARARWMLDKHSYTHAHALAHAPGHPHTHTPNTQICNTYRFSMATMVSWTRPDVTLCAHCLSYFFLSHQNCYESPVSAGRVVSERWNKLHFLTWCTSGVQCNRVCEAHCSRSNLLLPTGYSVYHQVQHSQIRYFAHAKYLCVSYGSQNEQRFFTYAGLINWFSKPRRSVFTARYELDL
jgi:hypothetical protein